MKILNKQITEIDDETLRDPELSMAIKEAVRTCIDPILDRRGYHTAEKVMQRLQEENEQISK